MYCEHLDQKLPLCTVSDGSRLNSSQEFFDKANGRNKTVRLDIGLVFITLVVFQKADLGQDINLIKYHIATIIN